MSRDTPQLHDGASADGVPLAGFRVDRGMPSPLGSTVLREGVNFAVFSRHASSVTLVLYSPDQSRPLVEIPLDPRYHRTGDIWHLLIRDLGAGLHFGWRVDGPPTLLSRFKPAKVLHDPYSRALVPVESGVREHGRARTWRSVIVHDDFDWGSDRPIHRHLADTVIYELHVRGFTRHASSGVDAPGTFHGVIEKIPYLKDLGVTAVELMPVAEFDELDNARFNPLTGEHLVNFWGYHPIGFFAPKGSYAADSAPGAALREFKEMVKALHAAGIEVILDVVLNHTGEGDDRGQTLCFRGLDNQVYYILDPRTGAYRDFTGCGNTVNCNHPVVREMILDSLRFWVTEMHVDGFRFDLASILGRGSDGEVMANAPVLERITLDPVLAGTKLIAEAWDAAGLYQVGTFCSQGRWAEWNGKFRDDVRRFVRGDPDMVPTLATRLAGSSDLYQTSNRAPFHSINFVTSHDGFTLADLVSYNEKHNEPNGEGNADGHPENISWNCGVEGPSDDPIIAAVRRRQVKNFAVLMMFSQGVPMILSGDEMGRSQAGNNNAYCHDNELAWIDWRLLATNAGHFRFFRILIEFRRRSALLHRRTFFEDNGAVSDVIWHGVEVGAPDWSSESRQLGMHLRGDGHEPDIYLMTNAHWESRRFALPHCAGGRRWHRFIDTVLEPPHDIAEERDLFRLPDAANYLVAPRTTVVLLGR